MLSFKRCQCFVLRPAKVLDDLHPSSRAGRGKLAFQICNAAAQAHIGTLPLSVNWFQKMMPSFAEIGHCSSSYLARALSLVSPGSPMIQ
jgi:hypothetical protein